MVETIYIAPSVRSANWAYLAKEVEKLENAGADMLHFDVADGHFINDLAMGPLFVSTINKLTKLPLDVHLMFERPENIIPMFADAGANNIIIHVESTSQIHRTLETIRELGKSPGVALNPGTPIEAIKELLPIIDRINIMFVNPGFGGKPILSVLEKVRILRNIIVDNGLNILIQADGGVSMETRDIYAEAGVRSFVTGYPIFSKEDYKTPIEDLKKWP